MDRVLHHRAVDRDVVLGDEVREHPTDDEEQDRQRLRRATVCEKAEEHDEQAQPDEQVGCQAQVVEPLLAIEPSESFPMLSALQTEYSSTGNNTANLPCEICIRGAFDRVPWVDAWE